MAMGTDQVVGLGLISISLSLSLTTLPGASLTIHHSQHVIHRDFLT